MIVRRRNAPARRGAAIAEFAVVAPVLFMLVVGLVEIGRLVMIAQMSTNASREAARYAAQGTADTNTIDSYVRTYLTAAGIRNTASGNGSSTSVTIEYWNGSAWTSTTNPSNLSSGTQVRATIGIDFNQVSWLPARFFVGNNTTVQGVSIARKE